MRFLRLGRTEIKGAWAPVEGLEKTTRALVYALRRCACAKSSLFIDSRNARGSRGQSQANVALSSSRLMLAALDFRSDELRAVAGSALCAPLQRRANNAG